MNNFIDKRAGSGTKIAIVTKRALTVNERLSINKNLKLEVEITYFTDNGYRKNIETFDEVIFLGNPNYFGEYVKNTFKGKTITFISYDLFNNYFNAKKIFEDIDCRGTYSTIYENIIFGEPAARKVNITLEKAEFFFFSFIFYSPFFIKRLVFLYYHTF